MVGIKLDEEFHPQRGFGCAIWGDTIESTPRRIRFMIGIDVLIEIFKVTNPVHDNENLETLNRQRGRVEQACVKAVDRAFGAQLELRPEDFF